MWCNGYVVVVVVIFVLHWALLSRLSLLVRSEHNRVSNKFQKMDIRATYLISIEGPWINQCSEREREESTNFLPTQPVQCVILIAYKCKFADDKGTSVGHALRSNRWQVSRLVCSLRMEAEMSIGINGKYCQMLESPVGCWWWLWPDWWW